MTCDGIYRLLQAGPDDDGVVRVRRAQMMQQLRVRLFADMLAGDHQQVVIADAVVRHVVFLEQRGADGGAPVLVHAAVQLHVDSLRAGTADHGERFILHAHAVLIDEVRDDHRAAGDPRQLDRLLEGVQVGHRVHPRVDGHGPGVRCRDAAEGGHFRHRCARGIRRAKRHADCAVLQRPAAQRAHGFNLLFIRGGKRVGCAGCLA